MKSENRRAGRVQILSLWLWLSYRFEEDAFPGREHALAAAEQLIALMHQGLQDITTKAVERKVATACPGLLCMIACACLQPAQYAASSVRPVRHGFSFLSACTGGMTDLWCRLAASDPESWFLGRRGTRLRQSERMRSPTSNLTRA